MVSFLECMHSFIHLFIHIYIHTISGTSISMRSRSVISSPAAPPRAGFDFSEVLALGLELEGAAAEGVDAEGAPLEVLDG